MRSEAEAISFIDESKFALDQLYVSLNERLNILSDLQKKLDKQLHEIKYRTEIEHTVFVEQDQWSDNANYYYGRYIEQMKSLQNQSQQISDELNDLDNPVRQKQIFDETLARLGATEAALDNLAAAVLQTAKQSISYRFGRNRPNLNGVRLVGTQPIVNVIWEGRNNGIHWEDGGAFQRVTDMFNQLNADFGLNLLLTENNALKVIELLGWKNSDDVITDLKLLVQATQA
jgi:hypothetical protein